MVSWTQIVHKHKLDTMANWAQLKFRSLNKSLIQSKVDKYKLDTLIVSLGWRVNVEKLERGERREWLEWTDEGWME